MDTEIRERLTDLATDVPTSVPVPPRLVGRARRRIALNVVGASLVAAIVALGIFDGVRAIDRTDRAPATGPTPNAFAKVHGWIAYSVGNQPFAVDPLDPANPVPVAPAHAGTPIGWSLDGSRLLLRRVAPGGGDLWVLSGDGAERRVTDDATALWGSLSPDGSKVAYWTEGTGDLFVVDALGGPSRRLVRGNAPTLLLEPAWSPDGSEIAFFTSSHLRGSWTVAVVGIDGTDRRTVVDLSDRPLEECGGLTWSPDGSRLAFFGARSKDLADIFVAEADGSGARSITHGGDDVWPTWSPDGSQVAFVRGRDHSLVTASPDGSHQRTVEGIHPDWAIAWNPVP